MAYKNISCIATRLRSRPLLQWFCEVGQLERVKVPSKSTIQRYATWLPEEEMREAILHKAWREEAMPRFKLDFLPPYSPHVNPSAFGN